MTQLPEDRRYTAEHEWARLEGDLVRVGITDYAQDQLGDVVYVDLPTPGAAVTRGQPFGEVESTKSVSDLYAPLTGEIAERNETLHVQANVGIVNADPYGAGWLIAIRPADPAEFDTLLSVEDYRALVGA